MSLTVRKFSKRVFILANVLVALLFLLACLQPWLNPETFWLIGFLSLTLPYLVLVLLGFIIFWIVFRPSQVFISLLALAIGFKQVSTLFAFNAPGFSVAKQKDHLRIMTWNVSSLRGRGKLSNKQSLANRQQIFDLVAAYRPDVICMQEFGQFDKPEAGRDNIKALEELGFRHHVLSKDYTRVLYGYSSGLAIFSRMPIVAKKRIPFTSSPESLLYADVIAWDDTIRIFTAHLQSFKFGEQDELDLKKLRDRSEDEVIANSKNIFVKMRRAFRNRGQQADQVRPWLDSCSYPLIFGGDLNDVPGSYAYWQLRGNRNDAFLEKGFGIGRTFMDLAPTLRIDHLFASPRLEVTQCGVVYSTLSDHLPVITDVLLASEE